jgi:hypothetical protein
VPLPAQHFGLPALPGQRVWSDVTNQARNAAGSLQILDPAPIPRQNSSHQPASVPRGAQATRGLGLGGAILSLASTRGARRIGLAALAERDIRLREPNDDGGRHAPRHRLSISRFLEAFTSGRPLFDLGWGFGEHDVGAVHHDNLPVFDPSFIHTNKTPRLFFTYDFDTVPLSSRQQASASTSQSVPSASRFTNSISNLLSSKRKASALIDLATDAEKAKLAGDPSPNLPTLICVGCDKPLLLGGEGDDRIWGLRCGHLICGACLDRIGCPLPPPPKPLIVKLEEALSTKPLEASAVGGRRTWKGKARQISPERDSSLGHSPLFQDPSSGPSAPIHTSGASASRYASLRPRRNAGQGGQGSASGSSAHRPVASSSQPAEVTPPNLPSEMSFEFEPEVESQQTAGTSLIRGKRKKKAKGRTWKSARSRVFQQWDYACPVEGCHRLHTRVLVGTNSQEALWKPKGDSGEIAVYTS